MKKSVLLLIIFTVLCAGCGDKKDAADAADNTPQPDITAETPVMNETPAIAENTNDESAMQPEEPDTGADDIAPVITDNTENTEESETDTGDMTGRDLFADFIMGRGVAKVTDDFLSANVMIEPEFEKNTEYTVSELEEILADGYDLSNISNPTEVSYAPLECHGEFLYVLSLFYDVKPEPVTEYLIFSDHSGTLEMKFAADRWTRRDIRVNEAGIVVDSGSNGAGSHSYTTYAPDPSFAYKKVSDVEENYYGYSFYDEDGNAIEALNATIEEVGCDDPATMYVAYYREVINDRAYYYFLGGAGSITQKTVDYIDGIAKKHGFKFDGRAAADEARKAYVDELGISDVYDSEDEPQWKIL